MRQTSVGKKTASRVSKIQKENVNRDCVSVEVRMCRYCGYVPLKTLTPPDGRCPKCNYFSWEQLIVPLRISPYIG